MAASQNTVFRSSSDSSDVAIWFDRSLDLSNLSISIGLADFHVFEF